MLALLGLVEVVFGASRDDFFLVQKIVVEHLQKVQDLRLVVYQGKHDHAEGVLHLRVLVEVI